VLSSRSKKPPLDTPRSDRVDTTDVWLGGKNASPDAGLSNSRHASPHPGCVARGLRSFWLVVASPTILHDDGAAGSCQPTRAFRRGLCATFYCTAIRGRCRDDFARQAAFDSPNGFNRVTPRRMNHGCECPKRIRDVCPKGHRVHATWRKYRYAFCRRRFRAPQTGYRRDRLQTCDQHQSPEFC